MIQSFAFYMMILRKAFSDYCSRRLAGIGLSPGLLYFLLYMGKHPGCTPGELARAISMDAGHTARSVGRLEQSGFLIQKPSETDRRSRRLYLTDKGDEAFALCRNLFALWDEEILQNLTQDERDVLMTLLEKAAENGIKEGGKCSV